MRAFRHVPGKLVARGQRAARSRRCARSPTVASSCSDTFARENLPALYSRADCLVLPSRSEAWGMVLNEAAAAGLPLVATEAAGGGYDLIDQA